MPAAALAVLVGVGFRTNAVGARQLEIVLAEQGVHTVLVDLPRSVMHLMGALRIFDHDLAFARTRLLPGDALHALAEILGDEHDLADLALHLVENPPRVAKDYVLTLIGQIDGQRSRLQREALRVGKKLYASSPEKYIDRLGTELTRRS